MRNEAIDATVVRFGEPLTGARLTGDVVVEVPCSCVDFEANVLAHGLREYVTTAILPRHAAVSTPQILYRLV